MPSDTLDGICASRQNEEPNSRTSYEYEKGITDTFELFVRLRQVELLYPAIRNATAVKTFKEEMPALLKLTSQAFCTRVKELLYNQKKSSD